MDKINNYKKFVERVDDEEWESDFDNDNSFTSDDQHNFSDYDNREAKDAAREAYDSYNGDDVEDDELEEDEDMEHLKYLLRSMFKNKGFDSISITNSGLDINLRVMLSHREKLSDVVSLFDIVNKLKSDILPQYDCQFEMWYNKQGQTMEFDFLLDGEDDGVEYEDEEDDDKDYEDDNSSFGAGENKKFISKFIRENGR